MNVVVITGSPHANGTSAYLADQFMKGAKEAGHTVHRFDAGLETVYPCFGCDHCRTSGTCIHKDGIGKLLPDLLEAQVVVFVTPLFYFNMSAQLKMVIDRFYAINHQLVGDKKQALLLATAYDNNDWTFQTLTTHYQTLLRYLGWIDAGRLLAGGCGIRSDIEGSSFGEQAYQMGKGL
ncbi:MAG: flavodoxin family protein [Peptococcaceae bacterium]